jgi:hypothetical protein
MDIGPVNAIRPVQAVRPSPPGFGKASDLNPDLTGVFAAEFRDQQQDDSYTGGRKASRGLEDEDEEIDSEPSEPESAPELQFAPSPSSISFFA